MPITTKRIINLDNAASVANDDYIVLDGTTNGTRKYLTSGKALSTEDYTTADKTKLAGIAAGAEVNVQSDWTEADNTSDAYIANKPSLATVATSGSYNDLSDKPTMPNLGDVLPQTSASGAIASFTDGSNLAKAVSVVADIDAVQSGSGDPSPNNVRPISGWNSVGVTVAGKNLLDTTEWVADHYIGESGNIGSEVGTHYTQNYSPIKAGTYRISVPRASNKTVRVRLHGYDESEQWVKQIWTEGLSAGSTIYDTSITITSDVKYIKVSVTSEVSDIQIEVGSTATTYEAYNSDSATYTTSLGSTYYGGTLDFVSGVLTVTHGIESIDGTGWTNGTVSGKSVFQLSRPQAIPSGCEFVSNYITRVFALSGTVAENVGYFGGSYFNVYAPSFTLTQWTDALTLENMQICYELATPTTVQLTGQEVSILLGQNNIWADSGNVSVTYKADIKLYVDNAIANA